MDRSETSFLLTVWHTSQSMSQGGGGRRQGLWAGPEVREALAQHACGLEKEPRKGDTVRRGSQVWLLVWPCECRHHGW